MVDETPANLATSEILARFLELDPSFTLRLTSPCYNVLAHLFELRNSNHVDWYSCPMHLYEAHLPVSDLDQSINFYREILGWRLGYENRERNIAFLLSNDEPETMIGLWGPGSLYGTMSKHHVAFWMELDELLVNFQSMKQEGFAVHGFSGETEEPSVIGWMPTAQFYFDDLDGHSVEFIARVQGESDPSFLGPLSDWMVRL